MVFEKINDQTYSTEIGKSWASKKSSSFSELEYEISGTFKGSISSPKK